MRHYLVLLVSGFICIQADVRAESTDLVTIVFGSCARQDRPAPIWATMASNKPLMTVLLGDNIYADTKDMELMRAKYQMLASNLGFQSLRKSSPIMAVWDDHDYGMDDAGANYPQREASKKIILDFLKNQKSPHAEVRLEEFTHRVFWVRKGSGYRLFYSTRDIPDQISKRRQEVRKPVIFQIRVQMQRCFRRSNGFGWKSS